MGNVCSTLCHPKKPVDEAQRLTVGNAPHLTCEIAPHLTVENAPHLTVEDALQQFPAMATRARDWMLAKLDKDEESYLHKSFPKCIDVLKKFEDESTSPLNLLKVINFVSNLHKIDNLVYQNL